MTASVCNKSFYQCTQCGQVHQIEDRRSKIRDELYSSIWCSHCKKVTHQLWVGNDELEVIELYDVVLDQRYYNKTKQNNY
jgi:hypothetical protein